MDTRRDDVCSERCSRTESTKYNSPHENGKGVSFSRRKKKNRARRQHDSQADNQNGLPVINTGNSKSRSWRSGNSGHLNRKGETVINSPALRLHSELNVSNTILSFYMGYYILSPDQLQYLGFPVESSEYPGRAIIYKDPDVFAQFQRRTSSSNLNVNAKEFVPLRAIENFQNESHGINTIIRTPNVMENKHAPLDNASTEPEVKENNNTYSGNDAGLRDLKIICEGGRCIGDCSETSVKLQNITKARKTKSSNGTLKSLKSKGQVQQPTGTHEKKCARCGRGFFITLEGKYVTHEQCFYHWGKLEKAVAPQANQVGTMITGREYSCCGGSASGRGCTVGKLHVWNGVGPGVNGPLDGYVRTRVRKTFPPDGNFGIYGLDCEMCYTTHGMEVVRVTVVAADGHLVYDSFVRPENYVIDYNTRFSGIAERDLNKRATKSLRDVQNDLMGFINAYTILVGHGLENDLRALRIIHGNVIDTSVIFPHRNGLPYRQSLKSLVSCTLERDIQQGSSGHCSIEDARACMELVLWRMRTDFVDISQSGVT